MKEKAWRVDGTPLRQAGEVDIIWDSSREVDHNGHIVIYAQAYHNEHAMHHYVVVPGYKIDECYKVGNDSYIKVQSIPKEDRPAVEKLIAPLTKGAINFL